MNKTIFTETSIVNFSRLLCVVINRNPDSKAHGETNCQLVFDTGARVRVTARLAQDLILAVRAESGLPPTTEHLSEQNRKTDASAVSSAD